MTASPLVPGREIEELSSLKIRGSDSRMVPLQDVARIRPFQQARLLERLDGLPMVEITSDYSPDIAPADALRLVGARVIKEFELPVGYRLRWLSGKPEVELVRCVETAGPATRMRSATEVHEQERQPTAGSGSGFRL